MSQLELTMNRRSILPALLALLGLALAVATPAPARARAILVRSDPPDGAVVAAAPRVLQLWFDHAAVVEPAAVTLRDAAGRDVPLGAVSTASYRPGDAGLEGSFDADFLFLCSLGLSSYPSRLSVELPPLGAGAYSLSWRAIALGDRRESAGTLVFIVDPAAPATLAAEAQGQSFSAMGDDLLVTMAIRPNLPGSNVIAVRAAPVRRPARAPIAAVRLRLTGPGGATHELAAVPAADGTFQLAGDQIDRPGRWTAEIHVGRGALADTVLPLTWDVPAPPRPVATPWAQTLAAGALAIGGALLAMWARRRSAALIPNNEP